MIAPVDPRTVISASQPIAGNGDPKKQDPETLKKFCLEFEAILVNSMVKAMRKTVPDGGLFPKSNAYEMYQEMMDMELSNSLSRNQSIGIADQMFRQLQRLEDQK